MSFREYLHRIRSQLSSAKKEFLENKGKSDVELVDITGSSFLLDNIELGNENDSFEDTSVSSNRVSAHGIRMSRYLRITPERKQQVGFDNKGNVVSGTEENSASKSVAHSESTSFNCVKEGEMPRHGGSEHAPLRGTNSSDWTPQEDPTGVIAATYGRHKRILIFILSASILSVAIMTTLAATAIVLRNNYGTPTESLNLTSEPDMEVNSENKWILPDVKERKLLLQSPMKTSQSDEKDSIDKSTYSVTVKPTTPIIVPIPLFFKSASESEINNALVVGNDALHKREMIESELLKSGFIPKKHSPTSYHQYFERSNSKAKQMALMGFKMENAYKSISKRMNLSNTEALNGAIKLSENNSLPKEWCEPQQVIRCNETDEIYRTYDGSCNNLVHTSWGSSNMPFRRILQPDYADGISICRSLAQDGSLLPNPWEISSKVHLDKYREDSQASLLLPLWGQFISHDLILTASTSGRNRSQISCCENGLPLNLQHPECFPLIYHSQFTNKSECMSITRSAPFPGCELGPRHQFNQVSSFLDASNIYGSPDSEMESDTLSLRMNRLGRLKESQSAEGKVLLPILSDPDDDCNNDAEISKKQYCFKAGDSRVNIDTSVASMYTIWMRQHNQITDNLILLNRHWDDETLFQESRRILTAQIQHITYNEFLPVVLGQEIMNNSGLQLLQDDYYNEYDSQVDPTISNVFATAAFRFTDSMMQGLVQMIGPMWKNKDFVQLHKLMVNPFPLWTDGKMDSLLRGMANTPAAKVDAYFTSQLSQYMFSGVKNNNSKALDLVAINIQRGRDHGLASYTAWRQACGLSAVEEFAQLENEWDDGASLLISNIYKSVKDVDIYTGLLAEKHASGATVGPTLACLLTDQFLRLKKGDRYWYEGDIQIKPFSPNQLQMIRQTTLARIICDNSDDLKEIQIKPMLRQSGTNPIVNCEDVDIPIVNYGAWREFSVKSPGIHNKNGADKSFRDLDEEIWGKGDLKSSKESKKPINSDQGTNESVEQENQTKTPKSTNINKSNESVRVITGLNNSTNPSTAISPSNNNNIRVLPSFNLTRNANGGVAIQWAKNNTSTEESSH